VKVLPPGRVARVAAMHALAGLGPRSVDVPPVLHYDERAGVLELGRVAGRALHDILQAPGAEHAARAAGAALRRFHARKPSRPDGEGHGPRAEAEVLEAWLERLAPYDRALHARVERAARPILEELAALPPVSPAILHRDLHDKQVFVDDAGRVGLIDLDTLTHGDPGIDVANLLAHVDLRSRQTGIAHDRVRAALLDGYDPPPSWDARLRACEQAVRLRLACVYAFRPRWAGLAAGLLEPGTPTFVA
jgi:Ser/Thr protein kinase RdoA (MazF antagonist)